jgi:hypothetical protein
MMVNVQADLYNVHINDDTKNESFYVFFNNTFGTEFESSESVYEKFGVNPNTTWPVSEDS